VAAHVTGESFAAQCTFSRCWLGLHHETQRSKLAAILDCLRLWLARGRAAYPGRRQLDLLAKIIDLGEAKNEERRSTDDHEDRAQARNPRAMCLWQEGRRFRVHPRRWDAWWNVCIHPDSEGFNAANANSAYSKAEVRRLPLEKKGGILRTAPSRTASDWAQLLDRTIIQQIPLNDAELAVVEDGVEAMENCFNSSRISTHPTARWPVSKTSPRRHRKRDYVLNSYSEGRGPRSLGVAFRRARLRHASQHCCLTVLNFTVRCSAIG
jgi:hypothetical protein